MIVVQVQILCARTVAAEMCCVRYMYVVVIIIIMLIVPRGIDDHLCKEYE